MTLYGAARSQVHILNCSFISFVISFTDIELIHRRLGPAVNQHLEGIRQLEIRETLVALGDSPEEFLGVHRSPLRSLE